MSRKKLPVLVAAALLKVTAGLGQVAPATHHPPPAAAQVQQVSVPVPRAVSLLADVVSVLASRNEGQDKVQTLLERRRERNRKGPQTIDFSVPRNGLTRALGLAY